MPRLVFIISLIFLFSVPVFAEKTENYCLDKEAAQQWEDLAKKNPNDLGLQRLHALRLGICQKIEKGTLSTSQGIEIFEQDRLALIRKRAEEEQIKQKRSIQ